MTRIILGDTQYATVSVIIRKPFVSATTSQTVVARGDKLFITGVAEGNPSPGVAIWILGKNKNLYTTESVNSDATFSHEVTQATTARPRQRPVLRGRAAPDVQRCIRCVPGHRS